MGWKVLYLESVEDWLASLSKPELKSLAKELKLLELCGNELRLPHSKALGSGLFELRERSFGLRIYYTYSANRLVVLLCGGDKSTQISDIKKANILLKNYAGEKNEG